jgi:hypothetical protein
MARLIAPLVFALGAFACGAGTAGSPADGSGAPGADAPTDTAGRGGSAGGGLGGAGGGATGARGVWENVTPPGLNLSPGFPSASNPSFGAQDVLLDPLKPGVFYLFVDFQGVYKSVDWGLTFTKVSTDGKLEKGKPWGEAIAQDASYMIASIGNFNGGAWVSTDGAASWTGYLMGGGNDPYMFDIDRADKNHVIATMHGEDNIYESKDGGRTWMSRGPVPGGLSGYVFFIDSTTWLMVSQSGGTAGTRRTTNSGATWIQVGPMAHFHGNEQIYIDPASKHIYVPSEQGIFRSTDDGVSFTKVSGTVGSTVFATEARLYAMNSGATGGKNDPRFQSATRSNGTDWAPVPTPAAMTNGAKRVAVAFDRANAKWIVVGGHWLAGVWRFVE